MDIITRKSMIAKKLQETGIVSVASLAEELGVSQMTIRRDLSKLEQDGTVTLFHGGAQLVQGSLFEFSIDSKQHMFAEEKNQIAREAANLVEDGMTVFLDAGTTCASIAKYLSRRKRLTVFTGSLLAANELIRQKNIRLVMIPGEFRANAMAFIGGMADSFCASLTFDLLFLSANGITADFGLSVMDIRDAATKRGFLKQARRTYAVLDSSKFGVRQFSRICTADRPDGIITDSGIDPAAEAQFRGTGINLITAGRAPKQKTSAGSSESK